MESRVNSPAQDWSLFFSALLNTEVEKLNIEIEVAAGKIKVKTRDKTLAHRLAAVLSNPENIRGNVAYSIKTNNVISTISQIKEIYYPESISINSGDGRTLFERLIGTELLKEMGCPNWQGEIIPDQPDPDCKVLYAAVDKFETIKRAQLNEFRRFIMNATYEDFRYAFAARKEEYKPIKLRNNKDLVATYIDKILYIKDDFLYFDFGFLTKCLIAPPLKVLTSTKEEEIEFEIDEEHLISYLGTVISENYILHVTGNPNDATQQARPICFNMADAHEVNFRFSFLLDCSGSMDKGFAEFRAYIKNFIKRIAQNKKFQNSIIQIRPFSTTLMPTEEFKVSDLKDFGSMEFALNNLAAEGETELDNALCTTLKEIESDNSILTDDIIFVWTDGKDSTGGENAAKLQVYAEALQQKSNPPKIFAIGFGSDCDETKLKNLASITGTDYIDLREGVAELSKIHQYLQLDVISKPRKLIHFLQSIHAVDKKFTVKAPQGQISVANDTITVPGNVIVNGISYNVGKGSPHLIPVCTEEKVVASVQPVEAVDLNNLDTLISTLNQQQRYMLAQLLPKFGQFSAAPTSAVASNLKTDEHQTKFTP